MLRSIIIAELERETKIIQHLIKEMPAETLNYKPAENMRTTKELLDYLVVCTLGVFVDNYCNQDQEKAKEEKAKIYKELEGVEDNDYVAAMEWQLNKVKYYLSQISDEDLAKPYKLFWGEERALGHALLLSPVKYLTAYKQQLFLYIKMNGKADIDTYDCWLGIKKPVS